MKWVQVPISAMPCQEFEYSLNGALGSCMEQRILSQSSNFLKKCFINLNTQKENDIPKAEVRLRVS